MSCAACALRIEKGLCKLSGIDTANVNFAMERATVEYDPEKVTIDAIKGAIEKQGYEVA
jgi:Cu+-exporting ATPase